jgi:hypothetical protein
MLRRRFNVIHISGANMNLNSTAATTHKSESENVFFGVKNRKCFWKKLHICTAHTQVKSKRFNKKFWCEITFLFLRNLSSIDKAQKFAIFKHTKAWNLIKCYVCVDIIYENFLLLAWDNWYIFWMRMKREKKKKKTIKLQASNIISNDEKP